MVDIPRLRAQMALKGYTQKSVVASINLLGVKISENTFSAKMTGSSSFDCDLADALCDVLEIDDPEEKAKIFLA